MEIHRIRPLCPVCGGAITPLAAPEMRRCLACDRLFEADEACERGDAFCPDCWRKILHADIRRHCLQWQGDDPVALAFSLMRLPRIRMHGPEHHLLVPAALLAAYCRNTGGHRLASMLAEADRRSLQVPGAACGHWGSCGAAIGAGIFASIVTETGPLSTDSWGALGSLTAHIIATQAAIGGPRCCKRDSLIAIREAIPFANAHLGAHFPDPGPIRCVFFPNNPQCKGKACPFFPAGRA